ncbi:MAG: hypothetical protein KC420_12705 [Myxococcales bacterium]|nr:hypothetical protein [Myxococcales bacterium]
MTPDAAEPGSPPPASAPERAAATLDQAALGRLFVGLLLGLFVLVVVRTAWMTDDAYITMRTVDNVVSGHGLRWNTFERVQAYTHPLWMMLLSVVYFVTREGFFTPIFLSIAVSTVAVGILVRRLIPDVGVALVALVTLVLSRSFVDFSTSGLENPLLHLLLALFVTIEISKRSDRRRALTLVTALLMLTRMDALLLVAPTLALAYWRTPWRPALKDAALGLAPLAAWELFSLVYYGFLFPNTAYAKLAHKIAAFDLFIQGVVYYLAQLSHDPLTLMIIAAGILAPWITRERRLLPYSLGLALYLLYIARIGGDFMAGRFFTAPLFLALATLGRMPLRLPPIGLAGLAGLVAILGLGVSQPTITSDRDFGVDERDNLIDRGVADERAFYYPHAGLLRYTRGVKMPNHTWLRGAKSLAKDPTKVHVLYGIGMIGFRAGPEARLVDIYGLADPLIARLPAKGGKGWRIGHFDRHVPAGYIDTLESGEERMVDPGLAEYNRELRLITEGPILSGERWAAIWRMNTGQLDHLIDVAQAQTPLYRELPAYVLSRPKENTHGWEGLDTYRIPPKEGLLVRFPGLQHEIGLDVSLANQDKYRLEYLRGDAVVAEAQVEAEKLKEGGLRRMTIAVPTKILKDGYDGVRIFGLAKDGKFSIGHMIPVDALPKKKDKDKDGDEKKAPPKKAPPKKAPTLASEDPAMTPTSAEAPSGGDDASG